MLHSPVPNTGCVSGWDLEYNKVIRHYHGHLSGVYALALHPTLDVLVTGGRDSVCRVSGRGTAPSLTSLESNAVSFTQLYI